MKSCIFATTSSCIPAFFLLCYKKVIREIFPHFDLLKAGTVMTIGERIKTIRKEKNISVDFIAEKLGVSKTTIYRYEDSTIEKIPIRVFDNLCDILGVTAAELMGNEPDQKESTFEIPKTFDNAQDAMEFIIKTPTLAAFGGYDPESMSDETIVAFANEILQQLQLVSYKYKNFDR